MPTVIPFYQRKGKKNGIAIRHYVKKNIICNCYDSLLKRISIKIILINKSLANLLCIKSIYKNQLHICK